MKRPHLGAGIHGAEVCAFAGADRRIVVRFDDQHLAIVSRSAADSPSIPGESMTDDGTGASQESPRGAGAAKRGRGGHTGPPLHFLDQQDFGAGYGVA
jgi:hypothetical protein